MVGAYAIVCMPGNNTVVEYNMTSYNIQGFVLSQNNNLISSMVTQARVDDRYCTLHVIMSTNTGFMVQCVL